ncbi:kinase-like protein, partial [Dimargaris cristalligena]
MQKLRLEQQCQVQQALRDQYERSIKRFLDRRLSIRPLVHLTTSLLGTYKKCNPDFQYESCRNPRRALTKPSEGVLNNGHDNENSDYVLYVNDIIGSEEGRRYLIQEPLGSGTFGQVVKCQDLRSNETVAVKVVKNKTAYHNQSLFEVYILKQLNEIYDPGDNRHILRLKDAFVFRSHLCLVFECLSLNLYEVIRQNKYQGLSTNLVRVFASQILECLVVLNEAHVIHCDLKPENILLKSVNSATIKVIDFGSACVEQKTVHTYIQSRFYRSPEVLLGLPYTSSIDMWSLGCIVAELFIGLPLFPGSSEYNQMSRIVEMLGYPPAYMIEMGKQAGLYFERNTNHFSDRKYQFKSLEQYSRENNRKEVPSKKYIKGATIAEIVNLYPFSPKVRTAVEIDHDKLRRVALIDFIQGLLNLDPLERWTPQQARLHPFITGEPYLGPF